MVRVQEQRQTCMSRKRYWKYYVCIVVSGMDVMLSVLEWAPPFPTVGAVLSQFIQWLTTISYLA
jgi:hypothetical protein